MQLNNKLNLQIDNFLFLFFSVVDLNWFRMISPDVESFP